GFSCIFPVVVSTLLALTLTPMMASKILKPGMHYSRLSQAVQWLLTGTQRRYQRALEIVLTLKWLG
ncbi:efflux RND transporter permease subunit, partial [Halomonas sp. 3D7M]|uniref:efflux RND transporter permease subunit n=1 Tax=Halomonas sp. 3D7M TaxID=2742617 RepID=UPI001D0047EA